MPCTTNDALTPVQKARQRTALERLLDFIATGSVKVVIGQKGGIAFAGWAAEQREGVSDLCAYRALMHAPQMRRAVLRAEAQQGTRLEPATVASGLHSHDGGQSWSRH